MNNILAINIGKSSFNVFMSDYVGIVDNCSAVHKHNYAEIHIVSGGKAEFNIQGEICKVTDTSITAIPGDVFHSWNHLGDNIIHYAFQTDIPLCQFKMQKINPAIVEEFLKQMHSSRKTNNYTILSAYFNILCTVVCDVDAVSVQPNTDYGFVIYEFFHNRYSEDVKLMDLSKELHLSERQTERLVNSVTGRSFRNQLAYTRIAMAQYMIKISDMSLSEVARYVGYKSYAGFWKAYKKHHRINLE